MPFKQRRKSKKRNRGNQRYRRRSSCKQKQKYKQKQTESGSKQEIESLKEINTSLLKFKTPPRENWYRYAIFRRFVDRAMRIATSIDEKHCKLSFLRDTNKKDIYLVIWDKNSEQETGQLCIIGMKQDCSIQLSNNKKIECNKGDILKIEGALKMNYEQLLRESNIQIPWLNEHDTSQVFVNIL